MSRRLIVIMVGMAALGAWSGTLRAAPITVPNGSFESPATEFVNTHVDSWQKPPKPAWYDESGGAFWDQRTGVFTNTPPGNSDHIDNCDGGQAVWLFADPEVALFQDYDSMDWDDPSPTHDFNVKFEAGKSYHLTVGIIRGAYPMQEGVSLELSLYYRDSASNMVVVAATSLTNSPAIFSNTTHFIDFQVHVPTVKPTDAWAGQHLGIHVLSTVSSNLAGGYWDLDNIRLSAVAELMLLSPVWTNSQFQLTLQGEPGLRFEMLATTDLTLSVSNWTSLGTLTNVTGTIRFADTAPNGDR